MQGSLKHWLWKALQKAEVFQTEQAALKMAGLTCKVTWEKQSIGEGQFSYERTWVMRYAHMSQARAHMDSCNEQCAGRIYFLFWDIKEEEYSTSS